MLTRIISGVVGSVLIILTLAFNKTFPIAVNIIIALVSLICTTELIKAKGLLNNIKISLPCMLFSVIAPMLIATQFVFPIFILFSLTMFIVMLINHEKFNFTDLAFIYTGVCVITGGLSCMIAMCDLNRNYTGFAVTLCLVIPWIADAGAYFVGSFFGKHKMCPKISPKKTIEGAVGGTIFGVLGAFVDIWAFQIFIFHGTEQINYLNLFIIAFIGTFISIVGDLSFSIIKRSCNVKDYGNVIPGHGGLLDRFDSVIFTTPFIFMAVQFLPILTFA